MGKKLNFRVRGYDKDNDVYETILESPAKECAKQMAEIILQQHLNKEPIRRNAKNKEPFDWFVVDNGSGKIIETYTNEYPQGMNEAKVKEAAEQKAKEEAEETVISEHHPVLYKIQMPDGYFEVEVIDDYTCVEFVMHEGDSYQYERTMPCGQKRVYVAYGDQLDRYLHGTVYTFDPDYEAAIAIFKDHWTAKKEKAAAELQAAKTMLEHINASRHTVTAAANS